jgi:hypothetical protein
VTAVVRSRGRGKESQMEVTALTWFIGIAGLALIALLGALQLVAVVKPRGEWTIENVYGGDPATTDATAYFAFNQGFAWADVFLWAPLQVAGSIGMLVGERWGFALALAASVPYVYTAIQFFIWDRDLGFRSPTVFYWVIVWAMWPAFGVLQGIYSFIRLIE